MLARLMAITDLAGLRVVCLLALARGMAGDAVGVGVVGVMATMVAGVGATDVVAMATPVVAMVTGAAAMVMVAGSLANADLCVVRRAEGFMAALSLMAVAASTVVVAGSTAAVVDTAVADTGNRGGSGAS
jgi:hypothetical protein